jgi:pyruvate/2-oxoglutarate dehydrogenase complex dihydrolipoamide dehydrogenase (E3) component
MRDATGGGGIVKMEAVRDRKREMVNGLIDMHAGKYKDFGVELIWGEGKFTGAKKIEVTGADGDRRTLTGDKVIVCTGSRAKIEDIIGLTQANPLTHIEILELDNIPSHLVVLGGGYIGLEFAQAMRRLGAEVTIVERNERILKKEDEDISKILTGVLKVRIICVISSCFRFPHEYLRCLIHSNHLSNCSSSKISFSPFLDTPYYIQKKWC